MNLRVYRVQIRNRQVKALAKFKKYPTGICVFKRKNPLMEKKCYKITPECSQTLV